MLVSGILSGEVEAQTPAQDCEKLSNVSEIIACNDKIIKDGLTALNDGNIENVLKLWEPLALKGHATALFLLGRIYETGEGVEKNPNKAIQYYIELSRSKNIDGKIPSYYQAKNAIHYMFDKGNCSIHAKPIFECFYFLAEDGSRIRQFNIGMMYANGNGVPQNYVKAHMWYNIASIDGKIEWAAGRIIDAAIFRDKIAEKMSLQAVEKAQNDATLCIKQSFKNCDNL